MFMIYLIWTVWFLNLFMNMVIHDLRSPSEAIQAGLIQAKQVIENEMNKILNVTEKTFRK